MRSYFWAVLFFVAAVLLIAGCVERGAIHVPAREVAIPKDAAKMSPATDEFPPLLHSDEYQTPIPLPGPVNTAGAEDSPFIYGDALYFFFTPDVRVPPEKQLLDGVTGIWMSRKGGGGWSDPERILLQEKGRLALDGCAFILGDTMYFCSAREGYTGVALFTARFRDGRWRDWRYAGEPFARYEVGEMHVSSDGGELFFHSKRAGGKGGLDIWVSRNVGGSWRDPENLEAVNTPADEGWPYLTPDGAGLFFTRTHEGSPAVFRSRRISGIWSAPELLVSRFAGEPTLDEEGNLYFVHHFFRGGTMIEADIYVAYRKTNAPPQTLYGSSAVILCARAQG